MTLFGTVHFSLAILCIISGALAIYNQKRSAKHKLPGYVYVVSLLLVNLSALFVFVDSNQFGLFHYLAIISLVTLCAGFIPALTRKPGSTWVNRHAYFMGWSYLGLLSAGIGQIATNYTNLPWIVAVIIPIIIITIVGGFVIHTKVPRTVHKLKAN